MTAKERIYLFDTTLRDGQQTPGIDFSVQDKIAIAAMLDDLGMDYIEGGYPGANPTDTEFFSRKRTSRASFVGFGMTKRPGVSASNDPGVAALLQAETDATCYVAKAWDYHVKVALGTTNEENLDCIKAANISSTGSRQTLNMHSNVLQPPMRQVPVGSCCVTPMAARNPMRLRKSFRRL